ncbi:MULTISPECIES: hypothetical protein [Pacificibacter]|uniref:hypothetical protein n=1 Tax=Pacificibacter TaxID=1042323 RepID=UPI001C091DE1|nr:MULTISPECIES: hypothetical protein [Pacificibacter]MBU2936586.1 hypothetical protein [Pacificibacter marinus]MDO6614611.1 hypothetical protein [Pacificibacter sp. 1_MG-2023]
MNTHFLASTVLPICVLAALAIALPLWITPRNTRSQGRLRISVGLSAFILLIIGAVFMAVLYAVEGTDVGHVVLNTPVHAALFFLKRSVLTALVWGPLLALAWFSMAQRIERLKGKDGVRVGVGRKADRKAAK